MVDLLKRTTALILLRPGRLPNLAAQGLTLPPMGRFTEANGLLLARPAPNQLLAMRQGTESLLPELAPWSDQATLINLSDARIAIRLTGPQTRPHLSQLLPLDLHPTRFAPGHCAATMMAHLAVLLLQHAPDDYELQCGRSFAGSFLRAFDLVAG